MVPWLMCPLEMLRCAGASPRSDGVGGCQHLSLCKCRERKTEVKQSLVEQVAGRAVISLLLPQTHYLQQSINPSVPKNTSSGFLRHCLTAACLQLSKPYEPLLPPHCPPPLTPSFSVFPFFLPFPHPVFPCFISTKVLVRMGKAFT